MAKGTVIISGSTEAQALVGATTATGAFTVGVDDTGKDQKVVVGRGVYNSLTHAAVAFGI